LAIAVVSTAVVVDACPAGAAGVAGRSVVAP